MRWIRWALLAAFLGFVAFMSFPMHGQTEEYVGRREDSNNLRQIANLLILRSTNGTLPMKDGALDVYALVRSGDLSGTNLKILRSATTKTGPTGEEIERGDYRNFPWERYRGDGKLEGPPFPLLWERKPDDKDMVLVGLSDGAAVRWEHAKLKAVLNAR